MKLGVYNVARGILSVLWGRLSIKAVTKTGLYPEIQLSI